MKFKVYCGLLEWFITVDARTEHEAIVKGKQEALDRLRDADFWASPVPDSSQGKADAP